MRVDPYGAFGEARLLPVLACQDCEGTRDVTPQFDPWGCFFGLYLCENCQQNRWEGQSGGFEGAMCAAHPVRHELQDASGVWRR